MPLFEFDYTPSPDPARFDWWSPPVATPSPDAIGEA